MTLQELAEAMAQSLGLTITDRGEEKVRLTGRSADIEVMPFFGGWQVVVLLPGRPQYRFFEEDLRMMSLRVDRRLLAHAREQESERQQPGR